MQGFHIGLAANGTGVCHKDNSVGTFQNHAPAFAVFGLPRDGVKSKSCFISFDFAEIERSWKRAQKKGNGPRGASTISQQTAKNAFLWVGRSYFRKGLESYFTAMIELAWGKRRIMEVYLNIIEFGPGIFGVSFGKVRTPGDVSADVKQIALICCVWPMRCTGNSIPDSIPPFV